MRAESQWNSARDDPPAPDQTETESSMTFIAAKPATASARSSFAEARQRSLAALSDSGCASNPAAEKAAISAGSSTSGAWTSVTVRAETFARARAMPGVRGRLRSILAMQPAQCMSGTAKRVSCRAAAKALLWTFTTDRRPGEAIRRGP